VRYPRGPHAADAYRRLTYLAAPLKPPPSFEAITYDVPPPPDDEMVYVERPVLAFDDPVFAFAPPPPSPVYLLPPPPPEFIVLPPPPPPIGVFILPVPVFVPVPVWCRHPVYVAAPLNNVIFNNIHNTVVVNTTTNTITVTTRAGQTRTLPASASAAAANRSMPPGQRPAAVAISASLAPSLPPSVAKKATLMQGHGSATQTVLQPAHTQSGQPQIGQPQAGQLPRPDIKTLGKPLPGAQGQALPTVNRKPPISGRQQSALPAPGYPAGRVRDNAPGKPSLAAQARPVPPASNALAIGSQQQRAPQNAQQSMISQQQHQHQIELQHQQPIQQRIQQRQVQIQRPAQIQPPPIQQQHQQQRMPVQRIQHQPPQRSACGGHGQPRCR
jgi:hypothetical protein